MKDRNLVRADLAGIAEYFREIVWDLSFDREYSARVSDAQVRDRIDEGIRMLTRLRTEWPGEGVNP